MSKKILILTDSVANPRPFPRQDLTILDETYPYLIRNHFPDFKFHQLSIGNALSIELFDQAIGYFNHWKPDYVIVHAGFNDCRTEAFSDLEKMLIFKSNNFISKFLKPYLYSPKLINLRRKTRVSVRRFESSLSRFIQIFNYSKIIYVGILINQDSYEKKRPGTKNNVTTYNEVLCKRFKINFVDIHNILIEKKGFTSDDIHLNKVGHSLVAKTLISLIDP